MISSIISSQWRSYQSVNWQYPVNWSHPINKGLLAWWLVTPQWKGGTVFHDLVNGRNNGTLTNMDPSTDWITQTDRPGGWGALDFDGTDDFVLVPDNDILEGMARVTVSCWIQAASGAQANTFAAPLWKNTSYGFFQSNAVNQMVFRITTSIDNDVNASSSNTGFFDGNWHHLIGTYDGTTSRIYEDGVELGNSAATGTILTDVNDLLIGKGAEGTDHIDGRIDGVRVHDRALTAKEVAEYHELSKNYYLGLFNYWRSPPGFMAAAPVITAVDEGVIGGFKNMSSFLNIGRISR